ncbi:transmembrane 4 L6 family member 5-like [Pelodytes ibericus]
MCTGKCSKFIGVSLYPLAVICITVNIIMFFPGWSVEYIQYAGQQISQEVRSLGGIVGGGILVLFPAIQIHAAGRKGCCGNRCGMFLSLLFSVIGVGGALFSLLMAIIGMLRGPVCLYDPHAFSEAYVTPSDGPTNSSLIWGRPFENGLEQYNNASYLFHNDVWDICREPAHVVEFNIIMFSILLAVSGVETILCAIQMLNSLFGCICGTCRKDKTKKEDKGE